MNQLFVIDIAWQLCFYRLAIVGVEVRTQLDIVVLVSYKLEVVAGHLQVFRLERVVDFKLEKIGIK